MQRSDTKCPPLNAELQKLKKHPWNISRKRIRDLNISDTQSKYDFQSKGKDSGGYG